MGHEEIYKCTICGGYNVLYRMGSEDIPIGGTLLYYCKNDCVYREDPHCLIKGKSKLERIL